jgi:hypothetical protein
MTPNELEIPRFEIHATGIYTPPPENGTAELSVPMQKLEVTGEVKDTPSEINNK